MALITNLRIVMTLSDQELGSLLDDQGFEIGRRIENLINKKLDCMCTNPEKDCMFKKIQPACVKLVIDNTFRTEKPAIEDGPTSD